MLNGRLTNNLRTFLMSAFRDPRTLAASQFRQGGYLRGHSFAKETSRAESGRTPEPTAESSNPLRDYFETHTQGPGIFKWLHYFEIYDRHLARFVGEDVHIVEIGVYSGGSMGMWRSYFGPRSRITGVDIMPECKVYENEYTKIEIGDQADRSFWKRFRETHPPADVIIDDGGHTSEQQMITLEELLPSLAPGGVYICEDVHLLHKVFTAFASGLDDALNEFDVESVESSGAAVNVRATPFQSQIHSIHHYPYCIVIEKRREPVEGFHSVRRGTEWQPKCGLPARS